MKSGGVGAVVVIVAVMMSGTHFMGEAQQVQSTCSSSLSTLNVCAPYVVPGASSNPSSECCGALQAVTHDCLCSTLRIASRIPVQCNLPPLNCGTLLFYLFTLYIIDLFNSFLVILNTFWNLFYSLLQPATRVWNRDLRQ